jgi:small-conductance mechanosensitive channel
MPDYSENPIDDLKEALSFSRHVMDGRTKSARKFKQIKRSLDESFDNALKEILEYQISLNLVMEKNLVDQGLQDNNLSLSQELKALRKDTFDKLKLLEKVQKGRKFSNDESDLAKLILGGDSE